MSGFKNLNQGEMQFFVIIWGVIESAPNIVQKFKPAMQWIFSIKLGNYTIRLLMGFKNLNDTADFRDIPLDKI